MNAAKGKKRAKWGINTAKNMQKEGRKSERKMEIREK